jgi:hypothetical protein
MDAIPAVNIDQAAGQSWTRRGRALISRLAGIALDTLYPRTRPPKVLLGSYD